MGKGKVKRLQKLGHKVEKPLPLEEQIRRSEYATPSGRNKSRDKRSARDDEYVEGSLGSSILKQSQAQLQEINIEDMGEFPPLGQERPSGANSTPLGKRVPMLYNREEREKGGSSDEEEEEVEEISAPVPENVDKYVDDFEKELDLAPEDKRVLEHFMNKSAQPLRTLGDIIREKLTEKYTEIQSEVDASSIQSMKVNPEVEDMCKQVGKVLSKYRSGPLPKMFKVIPKMRNWEELVYMTAPDKWTAAAMYQAVRIFVSSLKEAMAQRFFNLVLLPRVRDDISHYKRLNFHLYQALCKALFKPGAFFKGVLLPLCVSGTCTLREAIILGSVLSRHRVPVLHSSAAILKIAEMDYNGANSIFLRIFFDKKYALPFRVVDACVYHFIKFQHDRRDLPVLWHQALLSFVQRYKEDLSPDQKQALMDVIRFHSHFTITEQVRRELIHSKSRGQDEENMIVE